MRATASLRLRTGHSSASLRVERCAAQYPYPLETSLIRAFSRGLQLWDLRSGVCLRTLPAHAEAVTAVDFNRDGTCIVSASHDGLM